MNTNEICMNFSLSKNLVNIARSNFLLQKKYCSYAELEHLISNSIGGFLATISQGLAYGDPDNYLLGKDGSLDESFLKGVFFRIPISQQDQEKFAHALYSSLIQTVSHTEIKSEFGQLIFKNDCITRKNLKLSNLIQNLKNYVLKEQRLIILDN